MTFQWVTSDSNKQICPLPHRVSNVTKARPLPSSPPEASRGLVVATGKTIAPTSVFRKEIVVDVSFSDPTLGACCIWVESMALAHPPPLVGAGIARPRDGRSPERPMGGGSRGPRRLSNAPLLSRRVGRPTPLLCPPPQGGRRRNGAILA